MVAHTRPRPPALTEAAFIAQIVQLARLRGWWVFHPHDSRRSTAGWPDLALVRPPRLVLAELKTDRGRVTPEQLVVLEALQACDGVEAYLWRPADWPTIEKELA